MYENPQTVVLPEKTKMDNIISATLYLLSTGTWKANAFPYADIVQKASTPLTIAEQERATIKQRQREGIESARSKGKHLGRPPLQRPENWKEVYAIWRNGDITAKEAMRQTGLKRSSFYRLVKEEKEG